MMSYPIPERMKHLDVDPRGYAVPFGVVRDEQGRPHFAINNEEERRRSIKHDLCSICGTPNMRGRWLIGGPGSAFDPRGCYIDMPMHDECAHYALNVCPYLAAPNYFREIGQKKWDKGAGNKNVTVLVDPTTIPERPEVFVAVMFVGQKMVKANILQSYVVPSRPYRKVEFWQHGGQITADKGWSLSAETTGYSVDQLLRLSASRNAVEYD